MHVFRHNLKRAIEQSGYAGSITQLSQDAALGGKTLSNLLNNKDIDISKSGPGIFGIKRVADILGVSLDFLVGKNTDALPDPTSFLKRFKSTGGHIEGFSDLLEYMDLYRPVDEDAGEIRVLQQGARSLSAKNMKLPSTQNLQAVLDALKGGEIHNKMLKDFPYAMSIGCISSIEELNDSIPTEPLVVKLDYIRVLCRLHDNKGSQFIGSYCFLI